MLPNSNSFWTQDILHFLVFSNVLTWISHSVFPQKMHACWFHVRLSASVWLRWKSIRHWNSLIISTWKEPKILLSEFYTASESSMCVCACVCIYINGVAMARPPCLPESSMSNSDSSPFSPQALLSPRAAEDDEVQLVRICYLLAKYSHLWQSCQIFVPKPNEHKNSFSSLQTGGQCFKSTLRNSSSKWICTRKSPRRVTLHP